MVSVSSTAVVVRGLESQNEYATEIGQTIIGVLIAQDLAIVPMIILIKSTESRSFDGLALGLKLIFHWFNCSPYCVSKPSPTY